MREKEREENFTIFGHYKICNKKLFHNKENPVYTCNCLEKSSVAIKFFAKNN